MYIRTYLCKIIDNNVHKITFVCEYIYHKQIKHYLCNNNMKDHHINEQLKLIN